MQFLSLGSSPLIHPAFLGDDRQIDPPATWLPQRREKRRKQNPAAAHCQEKTTRVVYAAAKNISIDKETKGRAEISSPCEGKRRSRCANTKARVSNARGFRFERQMHVWRRILITLVGKHAVYIHGSTVSSDEIEYHLRDYGLLLGWVSHLHAASKGIFPFFTCSSRRTFVSYMHYYIYNLRVKSRVLPYTLIVNLHLIPHIRFSL